MGPRPPRTLLDLQPPSPREPDARPQYIRFVCFHLVEGTRSRIGLFSAIDLAEESDHTPAWARDSIGDLTEWFRTHLDVPDCYDLRGGDAALCWYKPGAGEHIRAMWTLKSALEAGGVHVEVLRSRDPGRILYEDEHQVAAVPG